MNRNFLALGALLSAIAGCTEPAAVAPPPAPSIGSQAPARAPAPPATTAVSPAAALPRETVLLDHRSWTKDPKVRELVGANKLSASERTRILDLLFGAGRYLGDAKACRGGADLASARRAGNFVPDVVEAATGSFTTADAKQSLYLVANGECGATHADHWGSMTIAAVEGHTAVAQANLGGGSSLRGVFDVEGDGKNELLVTAGFTNQGATTESATLYRFEGKKLVEVASFGEVYSNDCDGASPSKKEEFTIVHAIVRPGAAPEFKSEKRSAPCPRE
jgi:hypothetical protein